MTESDDAVPVLAHIDTETVMILMRAVVVVTVGRWVDSRQGGTVLRDPEDPNRGFLEEGHGLGFLLDDLQTVVTCAHVVRHREGPEVIVLARSESGDHFEEVTVPVIARGLNFDIALLELKHPLAAGLPLAIARGQTSIGHEVFFYSPVIQWNESGTARTVDLGLRRSMVSAFRDERTLQPNAPVHLTMMIDAMVPGGSSGSPLLSADGTVVGMVYAEQRRPSFEIPTGMGWAIPSRDIGAAVRAFREKRASLG